VHVDDEAIGVSGFVVDVANELLGGCDPCDALVGYDATGEGVGDEPKSFRLCDVRLNDEAIGVDVDNAPIDAVVARPLSKVIPSL